MALVMIPEGQEYSLEDIRKNPNKYQRYGKEAGGIDTSYGDMQNDSPEMKFEGFGQNQQQAKGAPEGMLWKGAKEAARIGAGALASGISGLAGVPRNILDAANSAINLTRPEMTEDVRRNLEANPELSSFATGNVIPSEYIPSGNQLKETIGKVLPDGYLNPQGETEESIQEFASDIGSLLFPIGGSTGVVKAAKIAGFPNAAKFFTKKIGGSKEQQESVKLATTLLGAFGLQDSLKKRASDMYNKIEEIVPDNFKISSNPVRQLISKVEKFSLRGDTGVESKKAVNDVLKNLKSVLKGEDVDLKDLIAFKQDTNERLINAFKNHPRAGKQLKDISQGLNSILKSHVEVPKNVSSLLYNADNIYQEVKEAEKVHNFLIKNAESISKIPIIGSLLAPLKIAKNVIGGVLDPITGPVTQGSKNIFDFVRNFSNESVRNEYARMMGGAIKENTPLFLKHANNLGNELKKINNKPSGKKGTYYPPKEGRMGYYFE